MPAIITLAEAVQAYPYLETSPDLSSLIRAAEGRILQFLGRTTILRDDCSEYREGTGLPTLWLRDFPVARDAELTILEDDEELASTCYRIIPPRRLVRIDGRAWSEGCLYQIDYPAGESAVPHDLKRGCLLLAGGLAAIQNLDRAAANASGPSNVKREQIRNEETEYFASASLQVAQQITGDPEGLGAIVRGWIKAYDSLDLV